jgi:type III pantothenate kinase
MMLCIDCGNTRLKWGLREQGNWEATGHLRLDEASRLADVLGGLVPQRIVACNVAGSSVRESVERSLQRQPEWVSARDQQCGVTNRYDTPTQLGADRWAALIGARAVHPGPCLVICAGTATTIDVLDGDGVFQGGLILPGLDMMHTALASRTAQLESVVGNCVALPRNTRDAITSGTIHATLGAMEHMFRHVAGRPGAICLLSGGAADRIESAMTLKWQRIEHLVLEGLACIAETPAADSSPS